MSKYPKTIAAAGKESNGLKGLAAALASEIPSKGHGGDHSTPEVGSALREVQVELSLAGHEYAESRLKDLRLTALWVADGASCDVTTWPWRDSSFSVHDEARRQGFAPSRLDALLAEGPVTVSELRQLTNRKPMARGPRTTAQEEIARATPDEAREIAASILDTPEGRNAFIEELAERPEVLRHANRRFDVVNKTTRTPRPEPSMNEGWEEWLNRINSVLMDGAKLAAETDLEELGAMAALAVEIYQRITERKLDVEIRELLEAGVDR